jgi:transposase InsO family protein
VSAPIPVRAGGDLDAAACTETRALGPVSMVSPASTVVRRRPHTQARHFRPELAWQFSVSFDAVLAGAGIEAVKIPPWSPRANAYAERFVLTARTEVTDRMLIFSERHLRIVMAEYARHYNGRRPHRALQLQPPRPDHPVADLSQERVKRRSVLGGLLNEYERAA